MHALAVVHATPFSWTSVAGVGLGIVSALQLVPFQLSAIATLRPLTIALPTAVHAVAEVHETALNEAPVLPEGTGTGWSVQLVPFQRSATGRIGNSENPAPPTAVHAVCDVHDTPRRLPNRKPEGSGTVWTAQLVPFHACAVGCWSPSGLMKKPTSMHAVEEAHETEKPCPLELCTAGTDCSDQLAAPAAGAATSPISSDAQRARYRLAPACPRSVVRRLVL